MKKLFIVLLVCGGVILIYYVFFNQTPPPPKEKIETRAETIALKLADKYQAVRNWKKDLSYDSFTISVTEKLVTDKPILFSGDIDDIYQRDGRYFVRFFDWSSDIIFDLECSGPLIEELKKYDRGEPVVAVATITSVTKPVLALRGYPTNSEYGEVEIESELSDSFIATGTCLDVVYVGKNIHE